MSRGISKAELARMLNKEFHDIGSITTIDVAKIVHLKTPHSSDPNWDVDLVTNLDVNPRKTEEVLAVINRYKITYPRIE